MSTNPYQEVGFQQEISQATYVELITATRQTGKAIRTICDETSGELICDEGPSPKLRLRDLAFRKQKIAQPRSKRFVAETPPIIKNNRRNESVEYKLDSDASLRAQSQSLKAAKIAEDNHNMVKNYFTDDIVLKQITDDDSFDCEDLRLINDSDFNVNRNGWTGGYLDTPNSVIANFNTLSEAGTNKVQIKQAFATLTPNSSLTFKILFGPITGYGLDPGSVAKTPVTIFFKNSLDQIIKEYTVQDANDGVVALIESVTTPSDGIVVVIIELPQQLMYFDFDAGLVFKRRVTVDRIMLCEKVLDAEKCRITNVRGIIEWRGVPRQPVNIIRSFIQYKLRDPNNPAKFALVNQLAGDSFHFQGCDFWTQRTNGGTPETNPLTPPNPDLLFSIADGDLLAIPPMENMVWSVPWDSSGQDYLRINYVAPHLPATGRRWSGDIACSRTIDDSNYKECIVESITLYFLMNRIDPMDNVFGSAECGPDPASELDVMLRYKRSDGSEKEFTQTIHKNELYQQEVESTGDWKNFTAVPGAIARWETFSFVLDTPANNGLDQCIIGEGGAFTATGSGNLAFKKMLTKSLGGFKERCIPVVYIETIQDGSFLNEIQSIILPNPGGGTYTLTITIDGDPQTTGPIEYDASANDILDTITALSGITADDISVTGEGTELSPFILEFFGDLSATDIDLIEADASNLTGTGIAYFRTIRNGTKNERQTLLRQEGANQPYTLTFSGVETIKIEYNATLDDIQSAVNGAFGTGNIAVSGLVTNRNVRYQGEIYFDFIGVYASQNVPKMDVNCPTAPFLYNIVTNWSGGIGTTEIQDLVLNASGGFFTVTIFNPYSESTYEISATTELLDYDITAFDLKEAILDVADWLESTDIAITKPEDNRWRITFAGNLLGIDLTQMSADSQFLTGGEIEVTTVQNGSGTTEIQKIVLLNATGGSFQLRVTDPITGVVGNSSSISYLASASRVKEALMDTGFFDVNDITVTGASPEWSVIFRKSLGDVSRMNSITKLLICDSLVARPVPPGPYRYELPKPGLGGPLPEESPLQPLRESANVFSQTVLQRFLFDPNLKVDGNRKTLRQLALMKGFKPNDYNPYLRTCDGRLLDASYSSEISTQESYVIISKEIDSDQERTRILRHIATHREILPTRFSWNCLEI